MMDEAAHHLDLFFEHRLDPDEVKQARLAEMDMAEDWIRNAYKRDASAAAATATAAAGSSGSVGGGGDDDFDAGPSLLL